LIQILAQVDMPESVPGLISVVEKEDFYYNHEQSFAAKALARYKDPRAVPALKKALAEEPSENQRAVIIEGLVACNGLTETEQVEAIEAYASKLTTDEGRYRLPSEEPLAVQLSIGRYLSTTTEAPEALVTAVVLRADNLKSENPPLAKALLNIVHMWQGSNVDLDMIRRIADGSADADTINKALERKPQFHESLQPEIQALSAASGAAQGAAAVLVQTNLSSTYSTHPPGRHDRYPVNSIRCDSVVVARYNVLKSRMNYGPPFLIQRRTKRVSVVTTRKISLSSSCWKCRTSFSTA
jgi:HEAT repeats